MADNFNPDEYLKQKSQGSPAAFDPDAYLKEKTSQVSMPSESEESPSRGVIGTISKAIKSVTSEPINAAVYAAQTGGSPWEAAKEQFANMNKEAPSGKDIASQAGLSTQPHEPYTVYNPNGTKSYPAGMGPTPSNAEAAGRLYDIAADPLNYAGPALKGLGKIAEFAKPLSETLNEIAADRALKAAGAMKRDFNLIQAKGMEHDLGHFLLDNKIVTPMSTVSKVADRIGELKEAAGQKVGEILDAADASKAPPISAKDIALKLSQDPEIKQLSLIPGNESTAHAVDKYLNTLYEHPSGDNLTLREAQSLRQGIDKSINYNKTIPEMRGSMPYLYKMRSAVADAMNNSVNSLAPDAAGEIDKLKLANDSYSKLATLDKIAQNRIGALSSNEKIGWTDKMAAGLGMMIGHDLPSKIAIGGVIGAANKAGRAFGPSLAATSANFASKALKAAPETLSGASNLVIPVRAINAINKMASENDENNTPGYSDGGVVMQKPSTPLPNIDPQKAQAAQNSIRKAFNVRGYSDGGTVVQNTTTPTTIPSLDPKKLQAAQGSMRKAFGGYSTGGIVPGTMSPGSQKGIDSPQKDTTYIRAEPGEVVLPLHVTQSSNPPQRAKEFMEKQMQENMGPDKWANDGFQNLRSHVGDEERAMLEENIGQMMLHPKMKNLLITASKFEPGSKPLDQVMSHLKGHLGMK